MATDITRTNWHFFRDCCRSGHCAIFEMVTGQCGHFDSGSVASHVHTRGLTTEKCTVAVCQLTMDAQIHFATGNCVLIAKRYTPTRSEWSRPNRYAMVRPVTDVQVPTETASQHHYCDSTRSHLAEGHRAARCCVFQWAIKVPICRL